MGRISGANAQQARVSSANVAADAAPAAEVDPSQTVDGVPTVGAMDCLATPATQPSPEMLGQPTPPPEAKKVGAREFTVVNGDSMWKIAERHLRASYQEHGVGRAPTPKEIHQYWSRFVSANPVGSSPKPGVKIKDVDLIHAGWKLKAPPIDLPQPEAATSGSVPAHRMQNTAGQALQGTGPAISFGKLRAGILTGIQTKQPQQFVNSRGQVQTLQVAKTGPHEYGMRLGQNTFHVQFEPGASNDEAMNLAKLADLYSRHSPAWSGELELIRFAKGKGPALSHGDGHAAAITEGKAITFFHGDTRLTTEIFDHELGHLVGRRIDAVFQADAERQQERLDGVEDVTPPGWEEAAAADRSGRGITAYAREFNEARKSYAEDFAEAYMLWQKAKDGGAAGIATFKRQFPRRTAVLEKYEA